jgi:Xaa-Pro aminopeptidase
VARVVTDREVVKTLTHVDLDSYLLATKTQLSSRVAKPIAVVSGRGQVTLVLRDLERANAAFAKPQASVLHFNQYQVLGPRSDTLRCSGSLEEAILEAAGGEKLILAADVPAAVALRLSARKALFDVEPSARVPLTIVPCPRNQVRNEFERAQEGLIPLARRRASELSNGSELVKYLGVAWDGFAALDAVMTEMGVGGLLVASPLSSQDFAGTRSATAAYVLVPRGGTEVFVFEVSDASLADHGRAVALNLAEAVAGILGGDAAIGFEEEYLSAGVSALLSTHRRLVPAHRRLVGWRETAAQYDLPGYIVAANIGLGAVERAIAEAGERIERGGSILETEIGSVYEEEVTRASSTLGPEYSASTWFMNVHSSRRTTHPALPIDIPVDRDSRAVKIDAGVHIRSRTGLLLGSSDLARSLPLSEEAVAIYPALIRSVRSGVHAARPGTTGEAVHSASVSALEEAVKASPAAAHHARVAGDIRKAFMRNVGHLMAKEESYGSPFRPDVEVNLFEGAVGTVEVHWTTAQVAVGYEDMFVVAFSGAVPLSS